MAKLQPIEVKGDGDGWGENYAITAYLPDGEERKIVHPHSWGRCFQRALKMGAEKVIDRANHVWIRKEDCFVSAGVLKKKQPKARTV